MVSTEFDHLCSLLIRISEIVGPEQLPLWESLVTGVEMITSITAGPFGSWMYRSFGWHS
jgi:hypothetical protein